eukprot:1865196-Rhodomonas_salina.1
MRSNDPCVRVSRVWVGVWGRRFAVWGLASGRALSLPGYLGRNSGKVQSTHHSSALGLGSTVDGLTSRVLGLEFRV